MSDPILVIHMATPSTANAREHWAKRAKRVRDQRVCVRSEWLQATQTARAFREACKARPLLVTLTRVAPRLLDGDNLQMALKAIRDELALLIGVDDRDGTADVWWAYAQRKQLGQPPAVWITVGDLRKAVL